MDNTYRSKPHRKVEEVLSNMGISFMTEHDEFQPYTLDSFLPEWHLAIEVDGPSHHEKKNRARDEWLKQRYGIETLRIKTKGPWSSKAKLEAEIMAFIEAHSETVKERKSIWWATRAGQ